MTTAKKRAPARKPAPAKKAASKAVKKVDPLSRDHLNMVLSLIDASTFRGTDLDNVISLKLEMSRVAGLPDGKE